MSVETRAQARFAACVCIVSALLSATGARADDWPNYQHDNAHTGFSPVVLNPNSLDRAWQAPGGYEQPVVVGDSVYAMASGFGSGQPTGIASFDLNTGATRWQVTGQYVFPSSISVAGGLVVYSTHDEQFNSALYVRDAATGALKYTIPDTNSAMGAPTLVVNPAGGVNAYVATGNYVTAYSLGATSGRILWSKAVSSGGFSMPTIAGNSLIVAGPEHYSALDLATGAVNQFQNGPGNGGGGDTVAYDASRHEFYVQELYNNATTMLTAYSYTDNSHITQLWQRSGTGIGDGNSMAIGPEGKVYAADRSTLVELDPATGNILRSLPNQQFAAGNAPILSQGYLWEFTPESGFPGHTNVYNLSTFSLAASLLGTRGDLNTAFKSIGSLTDGHFLQSYPWLYGQQGFVVYTALPGDLDHNGHVEFADLLTLAQNYGKAGTYEQGDVTGDGQVDFGDLLSLAQHYGQSIPAPATGAVSAVPEPGCVIAVIATAALICRRRKSA